MIGFGSPITPIKSASIKSSKFSVSQPVTYPAQALPQAMLNKAAGLKIMNHKIVQLPNALASDFFFFLEAELATLPDRRFFRAGRSESGCYCLIALIRKVGLADSRRSFSNW